VVPSRQTKDKTSEVFSRNSVKSKQRILLSLNLTNGKTQVKLWEKTFHSLGESSMHNIGEFPSVENVSFLSQILMDKVHPKYYLSQRACQGILRRAEKRGKELPQVLKE